MSERQASTFEVIMHHMAHEHHLSESQIRNLMRRAAAVCKLSLTDSKNTPIFNLSRKRFILRPYMVAGYMQAELRGGLDCKALLRRSDNELMAATRTWMRQQMRHGKPTDRA